jgi:hypothetical protein
MQNSFFSRAARLASSNGICTSYTDGRVPFVFGENARHISLDKLQFGAVLDVTAAKILASRGIDTGIIDSHASDFTSETFVCNGKTHSVGPILHKMSLRPNADPQSYFNDGSVGSYIYENTDGKIFFVLAYDAYESFGDSDEAYSDYLSSYSRQKSLIDAIERIGRQPLPAKCLGHPFLYVIASKNATSDSMSIAIFNPFADDVCAPEIILGEVYEKISFINCAGKLLSDKVVLDRIEPYGTAAFEVKK